MRRIPQCRHLVPAAVIAGLLALPGLGVAASHGGGSGSGGASAGPTGQAQSSTSGTVSASGDGITITTHAAGFYAQEMRFTGSAPRSRSGRVVEIERSGHQTGGKWVVTTSATVAQNGAFSAQWKVGQTGPFAIRAVMTTGRSGHAASAWPTVKVLVYRVALATIYGPGLYGRHTACGEHLTPSTIGVANRTLPCGTHVSFYYHGRTLVVPVIDRGPYANGADWDLTEAASHALGMPGTAKVGAVPVSGG